MRVSASADSRTTSDTAEVQHAAGSDTDTSGKLSNMLLRMSFRRPH